MQKRSGLYTYFCHLDGGQPALEWLRGRPKTPAAAGIPPRSRGKYSPVPATAVPEKKVATLIFTQEFDNLPRSTATCGSSGRPGKCSITGPGSSTRRTSLSRYLVTEIPSIENGGVSADGLSSPCICEMISSGRIMSR